MLSTHFFIIKIPNKRDFQQTALNHSPDIDFKDFMKIYKKLTAEPYSSGNPLGFTKDVLK